MRGAGDRSTLWTAAESAAADRSTMEALGASSPVLMERAALACAHEVAPRVPAGGRVLALCGPGNNGGDGVALARILCGWGIDASVRLVSERHNDAVADQLRQARARGVIVELGLADAVEDEGVLVVDALLGTGAAGAPRGSIATAIEWFNQCRGPRVAIDVPSGVDADTGAVPTIAARVDLTVTIQRSKPGLHITPGRAYAGAVVIAEIGIGEAPALAKPGDPWALALVDPWALRGLLEGLRPGAHKGERGHVGVLGGSPETPGAAILAATAALRCGAGSVTIAAIDPSAMAPMLALRPEVMLAPRVRGATPVANASVLIVGPGLTRADDRGDLGDLWASDPRPAVWDASALAEVPIDGRAPGGPRIITPHPGEAASLLARARGGASSSAAIQRERLASVRALAAATGAIAVLKGEGTLIAEAAAARVRIAFSGGPGLATAGSGDCLTGFIAALLARGVAPWEAACAGVHLHGIAGELAVARHPGAVALDLADHAGPALVAAPEHPRWPRRRQG